MKICISSEGSTLDSAVDPRFGRCQYFMFLDTETMEYEAVKNPNVTGTGGVGVQSGQLMSEKGVETVLTGKVGPNALQTLQAANIRIVIDVEGPVKDAVEKFKKEQV